MLMKRKTTVYLDDALIRAVKVAAARSQLHEYQVMEQALRAFLGLELLPIGASSISPSCQCSHRGLF